jgi:dolichol-phosphate mannosyltransferase
VVESLLDLQAAARLKGEVINLGTGTQTTLREVVETVLALTDSRSEVRWGAMRARSWDTDRWCADRARAARLLGWAPRHDLREGLAKTLAWMESKGAEDAMPSARDAA